MPADYRLGYLAHFRSSQNYYYAGLLVTDVRGVPREFRHSEGVRPTLMQSTLYGDSLEQSLGADAMAPALMGALKTRPDLLLVDMRSRDLFGSYLSRNPPAALLVVHADRDLALGQFLSLEGNLLEARDYELRGSKVERVYAYIEDGHAGDIGSRVLSDAQRSMNLVSPFDRVRSVLEQVAGVDPARTR